MTLQAGNKAPDFKTTDQDGNIVTLDGLRGKKIVLYFYPHDLTEGCTAEACSLRDNYKFLQNEGYEVFGVSTDDEKTHKKFIKKEKLPFALLMDTDRVIHDAYGTWIEKSMYGRKYMGTARVTFLIDAHGVIEEVIEKVDTRNHAAQILKKDIVASKPPARKATVKVAKKTTAKKLAPKNTAGKIAAKKTKKK
ncbi:MAG TPA: thioredoxin-dependent thiol peroxidase [Cyclobacteriaceae bacterium]